MSFEEPDLATVHNADEKSTPAHPAAPSRNGLLSTALGLLALSLAIVIGAIFFTGFNPPPWVRSGVFCLLGSSFLGAWVFGILGLGDPKRFWAVTGLSLAALTGLLCVGMLFFGG